MRYLFSFVILFFIWGCKKDSQEISYTKLNVPVSTTLRDIEILKNGAIVICGGENGSGVVLMSTDNGESWNLTGQLFDNSINALHFINQDTGFVADADILIYRTTNGGTTWDPFYASSWPLTVNRNLRDIWFSNDTTGFVCGGKNFGNGVIYKSINKGETWTFSEINHELRGVCFNNNKNGIICGYGVLMYTDDGGLNFIQQDANQEFYTAVCSDHSQNFWMCDFNGGVYKSENNGSSWMNLRKSNSWSVKSHQLNCIDVSLTGRIVVAGPNGFIGWSDDGGHSWNEHTSFGGNDILKVKWLSNMEVMACGKNGGLYKVTL